MNLDQNTTLVYACETVEDVLSDIQWLIKEHYEELCSRQDVIHLAPDYEKYQWLEDHGKLMIYTVRSEGLLVGYSVWFIDCHIHYKEQLFATNDVIFLHSAFRNDVTPWTLTKSFVRRLFGIQKKRKGIGETLIQFSENQLRLIGVTKCIWHIKFKLNWFPILHRRGYFREDFSAVKIL